MCGIAGILCRRGSAPPLGADALASMRHRGPDARGVACAGPASLAHTRLAIVDLDARADQPMRSADGRFLLVYNGEVYNHPELRAELAARGARFYTRSDTEVVIESYRRWGAGCVRRFRGMFAFALWDAETQELFLARDRCGERPLVYAHGPERFAFASELKTLIPLLPQPPELDLAAADLYLHFQYTPEPFTPVRGARKLLPGHTLLLSPKRWDARPEAYWRVEDAGGAQPEGPEEAGAEPPEETAERVRAALDEAVGLCLRADVPVALALSGGIDSGAVAALAQKRSAAPLHAFSVGYPGRPAFDERDQARALARSLGMTFHEVELATDGFTAFLPRLARVLDEPVADPAAFGHLAVPEAAAAAGFKALLTGIGGDEVFWGYDWTAKAALLNQTLLRHPWLRPCLRLLRAPACENARAALRARAARPDAPRFLRGLESALAEHATDAPAGLLRFMDLTPDFSDARTRARRFYGPAMADVAPDNAFSGARARVRTADDVPAAILGLLFRAWLASNCLTISDRTGMSASVETRLPFLDHRLIELVMRLRVRNPDHGRGQKSLLRAALRGVLPDAVLTRPKAGFQPPVREWLCGAVRAHGENLAGGRLAAAGVLDANAVPLLLREPERMPWPALFMAYKFTLFELWASAALAV